MAGESAKIPSNSDIITFDLQPDQSELGLLCSNTNNGAYLASSGRKSPFFFSVKRGLEVHGHGKVGDESRPMSLLVFDAVLESTVSNRDRRIKWAVIEVRFEKSRDKADIEDAPSIIQLAPGRPTDAIWCVTESVKRHSDTEYGLPSFKVGPVSVDLRLMRRNGRDADAEIVTYGTISAFSHPYDDYHSYDNYAKWVLKENPSQKSGVPTDLSFAVLLARTEGNFICSVTVSLEVDWAEHVREWFSGTRFWNRGPRFTTFETAISQRSVKVKRGEVINSDSLEQLTECLGDLVSVTVPRFVKKLG
ncbi:hypothetical protein GP486_000328 [Trichoglossum hirsutum]|uniref:Uncharacterized protein n=1 Tax=Trichoglossum hirsutum TaxID=265104 RepID=A0A9P8LIZ8_9PEZI|nr:hypothetical protein GP486_000328 [Trichoglossum hirsutum]